MGEQSIIVMVMTHKNQNKKLMITFSLSLKSSPKATSSHKPQTGQNHIGSEGLGNDDKMTIK